MLTPSTQVGMMYSMLQVCLQARGHHPSFIPVPNNAGSQPHPVLAKHLPKAAESFA